MKALVFNMLTIAATFAAMTACTSESDPVDEVNPKDAKVEIKLNAGIIDVKTRADAASDTQFANGASIQLLRWDSEMPLTTIDWETNTPKDAAAIITDGVVKLGEDHKYYNENEKINTYFIGFYPAIGDGITRNNGTISYTSVNGDVDILSAQLIDVGSKTSQQETTPNIEFKHMLSQVVIKLTGEQAADKTFGKIKKVTLKNIPQNLNLSLGNGSTAPTIAAATNESKSDISLYDNAEGFDLSEGQTYTKMIVPSLGSKDNAIEMEIETENYSGEKALTVKIKSFDSGMASGTTNNINLTFKDRINITTTIAPWGDGENKSQDVDINE